MNWFIVKKQKKHVQGFVRLKGDREEVADLILTLNGCLLGSGQRNTQERTYRNRLLEDWLYFSVFSPFLPPHGKKKALK